MLSGINFNTCSYAINYGILPTKTSTSDGDNSFHDCTRKTYVTWKYDEEGNIVYYTYDCETGELISKVKCKNPASEIKLNSHKAFL